MAEVEKAEFDNTGTNSSGGKGENRQPGDEQQERKTQDLTTREPIAWVENARSDNLGTNLPDGQGH